MAVSWMAAGDQYSINSALKSFKDKKGIDPPRAGDPDHPDIRGILDPRCSGEICSSIRTPVTKES
jgi:hypothetical protein